MSSMVRKEDLPKYNGNTAFDGALRFFSDDDWTSTWKLSYGDLFPDLRFFAGDAFGVLYGLDDKKEVSIFWTDSGDVERLGIAENEFYDLVLKNPNDTIGLNLYRDAVRVLGRPSFMQNFAFKVETALGGTQSVDNLYICDRNVHLVGLGQIAQQIHTMPIGTKLRVEAQ